MIMAMYKTWLIKIISVGSDDGLHTGPEAAATFRDDGPFQTAECGPNPIPQLLFGVVGGCVRSSFNNAPDKVIQRIKVRRIRQPKLRF